MKKLLSILLLLTSTFLLKAQQDPQINQYMFNPLFINPAYAGSRDVVSAVLLNRMQWVGFKGAPNTQSLSVHAPLKNKKIGLGLSIINDELGPSHSLGILGAYAYRIRVKNGKLSFGLRAGVYNYRFDWKEIDYLDKDDYYAQLDVTNYWLPSFDFGMRYFNGTFHAGFALSHINQPNFKFKVEQDSIFDNNLNSHLVFNAGKAFEINDRIIFKPSVLLKSSFGNQGMLDINMSVQLDKKIWLGVSVRTNNGLVFITEYNINRKMRVGYSYDMTLNALKNFQSGSHELFIGFDFDTPQPKFILPRYF